MRLLVVELLRHLLRWLAFSFILHFLLALQARRDEGLCLLQRRMDWIWRQFLMLWQFVLRSRVREGIQSARSKWHCQCDSGESEHSLHCE